MATLYAEVGGIAVKKAGAGENRDSRVSVKLSGELTIEKEIAYGNPNIDAYFVHDPHYRDERYVEIDGQQWEIDWSDGYVELLLRVDEVLACAEQRAAEDCSTVKEVLESWVRWDDAPAEIGRALEQVK
ncbi:hypothetical protein [Halobellus limi]|uniref:Uncharacterized protein n=1 Tax=Halobellus limi TaxID=699433 RepID=A0A1H5ZGK9_9EURY|nr:hypothetical protein [Halobellus limi]QCC48105.1 hypothetical protein DV707_10775 [Halobellus limi]SEG35402.1 hypothetical protein SAMN04488133_1989 [Halobellus limi]